MSTSPDHMPLKFHMDGTPWERALTIVVDPAQPLSAAGKRAVSALLPKLATNDNADYADGPLEERRRDAFVLVTRAGFVLHAGRTAASYGLDPGNTICVRPQRQDEGDANTDGRFTR